MKVIPATFLFLTVLMLCPATETSAAPQPERPTRWAQPVPIRGLPNLHKVSEDLYRSAQPTAEGFVNLKSIGVKTVINLRSLHSDRDEMGNVALAYESIDMKAWHPEEKEIIRFLKIVSNPTRTPLLVHCQHGADRTGTMCAVYRMVIQRWTKEEAVEEMTEGDFGFHGVWVNLKSWINGLDIDRIKRKAAVLDRERTGTTPISR